jgi:hypothetical protein
MDENEQFFVSEMVRHARSLPFAECVKFLSGFLSVVPRSHPASKSLRSIYRGLSQSNIDLDLVQLGRQAETRGL